jgi:hypothetical protein
VRHAVENDVHGVVFIPSFMMVGSGIQVVLRLLPQHLERLQCLYYRWDEFMKFSLRCLQLA